MFDIDFLLHLHTYRYADHASGSHAINRGTVKILAHKGIRVMNLGLVTSVLR